ncbi:MAG: hypothetical protein ACTS8S_14160 [Giesbergeria sp.]
MDIQIKVENLGAVAEVLKRLSGKDAKVAYAKALNDTGFQVRRQMQGALKTSFDRVTPWIVRSPKVFMATPDKLSVSIAPTLSTTNASSAGGKVGVDPQDVLQAQEFGGKRRDKRSESVLRRAGILPHGMQTAIPREPFPGSDDGRGNLRGAFLQQLLSYLQAFSESGYKANATPKRKAGIHKGTAKTQGRRYFVAYGKMRGGSRTTRKGETDSRASNLAPGIWAVTGSGAVVKPVLMFIRPAGYRPRISMDRIARESGAQDYLDKRLRFRIREVAGI